MSSRRPLIAGNWKMNGLKASRREVAALAKKLAGTGRVPCEVLICPPATLIAMTGFPSRVTKVGVSVMRGRLPGWMQLGWPGVVFRLRRRLPRQVSRI